MSLEAPRPLATMPLEQIMMKRRALKRRLSERPHLQPLRLAFLGGSTANEVADLLELYLLEAGFAPTFYHADYGRYFVEAVHDSAALEAFHPDVVYVHTSVRNIERFAPIQATEAELAEAVQAEFARFEQIWDALEQKLGCLVLQNNFEFPQHALLGNLDAVLPRRPHPLRRRTQPQLRPGRTSPAEARPAGRLQPCRKSRPQPVVRLRTLLLLQAAHNAPKARTSSPNRSPRSSAPPTDAPGRCSSSTLDNTLWGGVIGDDGVDKIKLGRETPVAEAYTAFQEYCLALRNRGILLAVCSKNTEEIAKTGFEHPDSVLKLEHFSAFKANWDPKHENIARIAAELNLGADSFVFADDNPAERAIVEGQIAGIAVPDIGADVAQYAAIIEAGRYFEQTSFSKEDLDRAALYQENSQRAAFETKFADYGEYLDFARHDRRNRYLQARLHRAHHPAHQ